MRSIFALLIYALLFTNKSHAQQFNSDSWIAKPHGTITLIPTFGERSTMLMATYSLFPKWEFTNAIYVYNKDKNLNTDDGHSTALYAKYMFFENEAETGGAAVKFGTGMFPGTIKGEDKTNDAFNTYWVNFPITIPFFENQLSWDIMPGASVTRQYGTNKEPNAWGLTYSTRLAWYPLNPIWAIVGEVFGTEGDVYAKPEYKIGLRWEPNKYINWAFTYGQEFNGNEGAGFEIGVMIFTPQFACFGPCKMKN
jgi:hypothetical protein